MTKLDYPPKTRAELEEEKQKLIKILEDATEAANKLTAKKEKNSGITPEKTTEVPPEKEETKESAEKTVDNPSTPETKEPAKTTEVQTEKETTPVTEETLSGKDVETLLKNIKRDDNKIQARIEGLISEGIDEKLAKEVAETEEVISACLARIDILQKASKIKDQEKRLKSAQDKLDTEKTRMESLVKNMESLINDKKQKIKEKNEELEKITAQLQEMITKLKRDGNSDEDIEKILKSKNIPEEEINKLLGKEQPKPQTPEPEKTQPESGNPKPTEPTPEPTKPTATKTPENKTEELEKDLDEARSAYVEEYKKCAKEANKHKLIEQTKNSILNIFRKKENKSDVKIEDFFTDKLKDLETKYKEAKVSLQNKMCLDKKEELEKTLSGEDLDKALLTYRMTDILKKLVFDEKQKK